MSKRGKVLRDTSIGAGVIGSDGRQYEFTLKENWRSDVPPKVGMVVEFEPDGDSGIKSVMAVNESQLAKEQAEIAMQAARERGLAILSAASSKVGTSVLIAWIAVAISWYFMDAIKVMPLPDSSIGITFWNLLGVVNNSKSLAYVSPAMTGDKGIYALLFVLALAGPWVSQLWKHTLAHLGNCLPFVVMMVVTFMLYMSLRDSASQAQEMAGALGGRLASDIVGNMVTELMKAIHVGMGGAISFIASAYLAIVGVKRYLVAKAQM